MRAAQPKPGSLQWLSVREPSDLRFVAEFVRALPVNGYEAVTSRDGYLCFKLGWGDDQGHVTWHGGIKLELYPLKDEVEDRLRRVFHIERPSSPNETDGESSRDAPNYPTPSPRIEP